MEGSCEGNLAPLGKSGRCPANGEKTDENARGGGFPGISKEKGAEEKFCSGKQKRIADIEHSRKGEEEGLQVKEQWKNLGRRRGVGSG